MNGLSGAQRSLRPLRQEFKQLQRKARRLKSHANRVWYPTDEIKAQAVLIMILADETRWAIVWVQQWQRKWIRWALATPGQVSDTMLQTWRGQFADSEPVVAALQSLTHPWRVRVDCFLMETLLYEEIILWLRTRKGWSCLRILCPPCSSTNGVCAHAHHASMR